MTVYNVKSLIDAEKDGQTFFSVFRKQPTQSTAANIWFDLSMSPGNPVPNYYIGTSGVFTPLKRSTDVGVPHGGNVFPKQKFLRTLGLFTTAAGAAPMNLILLDYLGFYPFIDESVTDEQFLDNTVTLPRYADGAGVQMMPVVVAGQTGGGLFFVTYTNQDGESGRITPDHVMTTQLVNGTIITSNNVHNSAAPFMALQQGDTGVRSVDSIAFRGTGDIGLISIALVKPLARHSIREVNTPVETDFFIDMPSFPEIKDDAYLNFVCLPAGSLSGAPIHGYIKTVWI